MDVEEIHASMCPYKVIMCTRIPAPLATTEHAGLRLPATMYSDGRQHPGGCRQWYNNGLAVIALCICASKAWSRFLGSLTYAVVFAPTMRHPFPLWVLLDCKLWILKWFICNHAHLMQSGLHALSRGKKTLIL